LRRILLLALLMAGCAIEPDPRPGPIRAMEPRPNPPVVEAPPPSGRDRVRQNPWLTRSWEELRPDQRRRVTTRLRRSGQQPEEPIPAFWDRLGLPDRTSLVFGTPALPPPRLPARPSSSPRSEAMARGG
jgi:hypothetical protein